MFIGRAYMKKNKYSVASITIIFFLCSCNLNNYEESTMTINDIANKKNNIVYINESREYVPFIVACTDYYEDNVLLLRKDVLKETMSISNYYSYYGESEIDEYLNSEYLDLFDDSVSSKICEVSVIITNKEALGVSGGSTVEITRKVFLLSCTELGIDDSVNMGKEGKALSYFADVDNRIANRDGIPITWWLRSPDTYRNSCTYYIGGNGVIGSTNSSTKNGIRPAFCISKSTEICLKDDIVENKQVYTFKI